VSGARGLAAELGTLQGSPQMSTPSDAHTEHQYRAGALRVMAWVAAHVIASADPCSETVVLRIPDEWTPSRAEVAALRELLRIGSETR